MSESWPGACPVEEPSKFHSGKSSTDVGLLDKVLHLDLVFPSESIQTYSARTFPLWSKSKYLDNIAVCSVMLAIVKRVGEKKRG